MFFLLFKHENLVPTFFDFNLKTGRIVKFIIIIISQVLQGIRLIILDSAKCTLKMLAIHERGRRPVNSRGCGVRCKRSEEIIFFVMKNKIIKIVL